MSDIVERLRRKVFSGPTMEASHTKTVEWQAADEIERLREALKSCANAIAEWERKPEGVDGFLLGAMDNARAALEAKDG